MKPAAFAAAAIAIAATALVSSCAPMSGTAAPELSRDPGVVVEYQHASREHVSDPGLPSAPPYPSHAEVSAEKAVADSARSLVTSGARRWRVESPLSEPLAGGDARRVRARVTDGLTSGDLDAIVFDSRRCGIRVLDQPDSNAGGGAIASAMRAAGAIGGVNGGYFTPEFQPLGLMISDGKPTGKFVRSALLGGVVVSTNDRPRLLWRDEYTREAATTDLVQSGPRLVDAQRALAKLDRQKTRPRTFIATDGKSEWAIGIVRSITLGDLAEMLATPGVLADLQVARALNLDGGRSTAIWMRTAAGEISEPGWSTVRNFIAIVPRS